MERRREERFEADKPASVTILGEDPISLSGNIANASGRGLRILVDRPIPVNSAVRIDVDDRLLLGEVCYSVPEGNGFAVGLFLEQVLHEVTDVARLVDAILGEEHLRPIDTSPV